MDNPNADTSDRQQERQQAIVEAERRGQEEQKQRREALQLNMMRSVLTEPLLSKVNESDAGTRFDVIIWLNEFFAEGMAAALKYVKQRADAWEVAYSTTSHYCFARLSKEQILDLAEEARQLMTEKGPAATVVYRIWEDNDVHVSLIKSVVTIKADAAQRAFQAQGEDVVWAVMDSGIQGNHPHFRSFKNLDLSKSKPVDHVDFTPLNNGPLVDNFGHGTHVAGIIGGCWTSANPDGEAVMGTELQNEQSAKEPIRQRQTLQSISGIAPKCKLVSLKVVADQTFSDNSIRQTAGQGKVSWILMAIEQIQTWNQHGKRLLIHGVNMSLGYDFDPRWFGCGQSPLCVEVNRLVKSGVVVVVAAGNAGYGSFLTSAGKAENRYSDLSITDPGNADLAITVGSTHREMPHLYGVSYFSSRGPTGDGRLKPDLVAPGERIVSCAAGLEAAKYGVQPDGDGRDVHVLYCEQTGTSMAAPHVSGAVAAFLSVRKEFLGAPETVKEIFLSNTIDLRRQREFQGAGLLDLMKVLQAV